MFKLDDNFLNELGLGALPPAEKNKMLAHIYETLEMRVGMRLAEKMTNEQLDEFEAFINKNDEAGALKWLETNFPNYKQVVAEELDKLKGEISQVAPQIVQQAIEAQASLPQQPMPQPQPSAPSQPAQPQQPAPLSAPQQQPVPAQAVEQPQFAQPQPQQPISQPAQPTVPQPQYSQPPVAPVQQPSFQQPPAPTQSPTYPQVTNPYLQPQPSAPQPQYPQPPATPQPYTPPPAQ